MRLSLCIVARNEASFLRACIESARPAVDEVVVVDTGSSDDTPEIAERAGAKVVRTAWPGDLGTAHNLPIEHARGDWILTLDADEALDPQGLEPLRRLAHGSDHGCDAYFVKIRNYIQAPADKARSAEATDPLARGGAFYVPTSVVRVFRRRDAYRFAGHLHQGIEASIVEAGGRIGRSSLTIHHYGFVRPDRAKLTLYRKLARREVLAHPSSGKAWMELGILFCDPIDLPGAMYAFRQAYRYGQRSAASFLIGRALGALGQPGAAIPYLYAAVRGNPRDRHPIFDNADAFEQIGKACEELGRTREAEGAYRRALDCRPDSPLAANNLAGLLVDRRARRQAWQILDDVIRRHPGLDMPWATLGRLHLDTGNLEGARRAFETALGINEENLPARVNLGLVHRLAGRPRAASRAYAQAWEIGNGTPVAHLELTDMLPPRRRRLPPRMRPGGIVSIIDHLRGGAGRVLMDMVGALRTDDHLVLCRNPGPATAHGLRVEVERAARLQTVDSGECVRTILAAIQARLVVHHLCGDDVLEGPVRTGREHWVAVGHTPKPLPGGYDAHVVFSTVQARAQEHLPPDRVLVVQPGVDLDRFRPTEGRAAQEVTIAMVARLEPGRFPRRLAQFLPALGPLRARLAIAGTGSRRYEIEPELERARLTARVRFVGPVPCGRMPRFLAGADIGLSLIETGEDVCAMAVLEMLACGLPVVAQPTGALRELVTDGHNGFLAETETEIARRLSQLTRDAALRRRMGEASRHRARQYGMDRFRRSWRRLAASLAPPPGRGSIAATAADRIHNPGGRHARSTVPVAPWRPWLCYLICADRESDGRLAADALWGTGVAGRPRPYFREHGVFGGLEAAWHELMDEVLEEGSSCNGVFGAEVRWRELLALAERLTATPADPPRVSAVLSEAFQNLRYVHLPATAPDPIRSAVTPVAPAATGPPWSNPRAAQGTEAPWRDLFSFWGVRPIVLPAADFAADPAGAARRVLKELGLPAPAAMRLTGARRRG